MIWLSCIWLYITCVCLKGYGLFGVHFYTGTSFCVYMYHMYYKYICYSIRHTCTTTPGLVYICVCIYINTCAPVFIKVLFIFYCWYSVNDVYSLLDEFGSLNGTLDNFCSTVHSLSSQCVISNPLAECQQGTLTLTHLACK